MIKKKGKKLQVEIVYLVVEKVLKRSKFFAWGNDDEMFTLFY